jgi:uncharacterized protein YebE (UPF0316 family)
MIIPESIIPYALPLLIFIARIIDVSIGTIRIILISRGFKFIAPILGFFEVTIWLIAVGQIMQRLDNWISYFAYGAGFAAGTYVGMLIEEKLRIGTVLVRIITKKDASMLLQNLKDYNHNVTGIEAEGNSGKVKVIFLITKRKSVERIIKIIKEFNPNAFYTIEDIKFAQDGSILNSPDISTKKRLFPFFVNRLKAK